MKCQNNIFVLKAPNFEKKKWIMEISTYVILLTQNEE